MNKRKPAEVFHPGEHLQEELEARGMTAADLAAKLKSSEQFIEEILAGRKVLSASIAQRIDEWMGMSPGYWLRLQASYQKGMVTKGGE